MIGRNRKRRRSAARISPRSSIRLDIWLLRHLQVALASLGRLARAPLSTLMTILVIGIALALPSALYLILDNVRNLSGNWDGAASISLFLKQEADEKTAAQLAASLRTDPAIQEVHSVSREQALQEFRQLSGMAGALDALQGNPLPNVLIVEPADSHSTPDNARELLQRLQQVEAVELAQLDLQWVRRFHAITEIAQRGVVLLASLLGLSVLLIVGNTIRLEIQNHHAEIEITKLIGGTDAFIRRPFLYNGVWYGLFGGLSAWLMVLLAMLMLDNPVAQLAGLYQSGFRLGGLDFGILLAILGGGGLLGLTGSWIAVGRHLSEIEPT